MSQAVVAKQPAPPNHRYNPTFDSTQKSSEMNSTLGRSGGRNFHYSYNSSSGSNNSPRHNRPITRGTVVGLGTVGLGARCRDDHHRVNEAKYAAWKQEKEIQAATNTSRSNTTQLPKVYASDIYVQHKREVEDRHDEKEYEDAKRAGKCTEGKTVLKKMLHEAKKDDQEFLTMYISDAREKELTHKRREQEKREAAKEKRRQEREEMEKWRSLWLEERNEADQEKLIHSARSHDEVITSHQRSHSARELNTLNKRDVVRAEREKLQRKLSLHKTEKEELRTVLKQLVDRRKREEEDLKEKYQEVVEMRTERWQQKDNEFNKLLQERRTRYEEEKNQLREQVKQRKVQTARATKRAVHKLQSEKRHIAHDIKENQKGLRDEVEQEIVAERQMRRKLHDEVFSSQSRSRSRSPRSRAEREE